MREAAPKRVTQVVGAAILKDGRCLVAQRGATMSHPFEWEFPGGKVEPGETPEKALAREIDEELGLEIEVGELIAFSETDQGQRTIRLEVYRAQAVGGELRLLEHARVAWLSARELAELDFAAADVPIVARVSALLESSI